MTLKEPYRDPFANNNLPSRTAWPKLDLTALPELAAYPEYMNCATELVDRPAAQYGDRVAFFYRDERWSYRYLQESANRIAQVLRDDLGVRPGHRVLLRAYNTPLYVACWFAVMKIGAIAVATMPLYRSRELIYMADKAEIAVALCDARLAEEMKSAQTKAKTLKEILYFYGDGPDTLEQRMAEKSPVFTNDSTRADDVCLISFTSGTTGPPKGCLHFHRDILAICDTFSRHVLKPTADDIFAGTPPIAFTFGLGALVAFPLHAGAATVLVEQYTPDTILQTVQDYGVTILFSAPTAFRAMTALASKYRIPTLKKCVSAGETLPRAIWQGWFDATGVKIIDGIGSTELLHIFIACSDDDIRPGATGRPVPGYRAQVVDEKGNALPPGTVGRLAVQGPTGCRYLGNSERQAAYVQDGWNYTGDSYLMDADGYFWYQARTDDMIVSAGYNISGPEVEAVLLEHPKVLECAVVAAPDSERGHIVKAFVVLRDAAAASAETVKELQDFVKTQIAPYKYPRAVAFVSSLPRTQTGKVQRFLLRQQEAASESSR